MNRCSTFVLEFLKYQRVVAILTAGLVVASCGTKTTASTDDTGEPAADTESDVGGEDATDDTGPSDAGSDAVAADTGPDIKDTADVPDIAIDVPHECDTDQQCYDIKKANPGCQTTTCVEHLCTEPVKKGGANVCCVETDCADVGGQTKACNTVSNQCEYTAIPGWCPDKQIILQPVTFEQPGNLSGFSGNVTTSATGSTVAWQISSKRSHTGKSSVYFGNECYNYDTSANASTSCQSMGNAAKLTGTFTSPELTIPKDAVTGQLKPAYLHYWLWLDAEPPFLQGNAGLAGTSCTGCGIDQVCVNLGNGSKDACLTEKDTLKVFVNGSSVTPTAVWSSTKIGKSTGGKWVHRVINLAGFGATATVSWQFATGDGSANLFEGVYLDDISVETQCDKVGVSCDKATACTNTSGSACVINECTFYDNVTDKGICFGDLTPGCCAGVTDCQDNNTCTVDTCEQANGAPTGVCNNVPDAKNPQCCLAENLFNDAFENGVAAWKNIGSNSTAVSWRVNPTGGTGGTKSLVFADSTFLSFADPKLLAQGPKGTICSPEVTLKSGTLYDVAHFNINLETEWCGQTSYSNPPGSLKPCDANTPCTNAGETCNPVLGVCAFNAPLDKLAVTFNTNGQYCGATECSNIVANIKTPLWSSDLIKGCTTGQAIAVEVPLSAYAGKKGRVCFTFDAGDASGNTFFGPSIDDFKVDVTCAKTECLSDIECTSCKPTVEIGVCNQVTTKCECKPTGKCEKDVDCPKEDNCTVATCVQGLCDNFITPGCCAEKTQINGESFEASKGTTLPTGWTTAGATDPASVTGEPYDASMKWHISADNFFGSSPDQYSLYFGNTLGNYDAGTGKVPYGLVKTAPVKIPVNGTTILTFHLSLSTEWDLPAVFQSFTFAIDRLRVGFVDATKSSETIWAWSSYEIGGTTNGQWITVSVKAPAALAGKDAAIVWEFDAGSSKNNNHVGPYIDGINMWTTCTPPVCVTGSDCTPPSPDACKSYVCKFDEPNKSFSCDTPFKPGPGCCTPTSPLPSVTFENASFSASNIAVAATPGVLAIWNVIPHKYLNGKFEAYFGNTKVWNYDDPVANCGAVSSTLDTPVLKIGTNAKQSAQLQFSIWADIEPPSGSFQTEHFKVFAKYGALSDKLWDATDPVYGLKPSQFKTKQNITLNLTKYQGLNVVIEFVFDSGDCSLNSKYEGVYLDDIQVTEPCTP